MHLHRACRWLIRCSSPTPSPLICDISTRSKAGSRTGSRAGTTVPWLAVLFSPPSETSHQLPTQVRPVILVLHRTGPSPSHLPVCHSFFQLPAPNLRNGDSTYNSQRHTPLLSGFAVHPLCPRPFTFVTPLPEETISLVSH